MDKISHQWRKASMTKYLSCHYFFLSPLLLSIFLAFVLALTTRLPILSLSFVPFFLSLYLTVSFSSISLALCSFFLSTIIKF